MRRRAAGSPREGSQPVAGRSGSAATREKSGEEHSDEDERALFHTVLYSSQ
ncbi:MAG: hypothetical protein LUP97_05105 [Methanoregula sp.]|nr:hypothetical protein [Methanoregula sp.]